MPRGIFVTFEGLDGSGKSTQLRSLAHWLQARGHRVTVTRQPGGTAIGDRVRGLLLDSRTERLDARAELGLMFADRAQSIAEIIRPALERGEIVLCDRYTDSSEAYQGGGRELGSDVVLALHAAMCGNLWPEMTVLLLPDFAQSLERARRRNARDSGKGQDENRFEREDERFYRRVYDKYREIAAREPRRVVVIAGEGGIEDVHQRVVEAIAGKLDLAIKG